MQPNSAQLPDTTACKFHFKFKKRILKTWPILITFDPIWSVLTIFINPPCKFNRIQNSLQIIDWIQEKSAQKLSSNLHVCAAILRACFSVGQVHFLIVHARVFLARRARVKKKGETTDISAKSAVVVCEACRANFFVVVNSL